MGRRQAITVNKSKIAEYWTQSGRLGTDFEGEKNLYANECFACRYTSEALERAHILADCLGGPATKENLHLLCKQCHIRSEMLHGETYWRWIIARRSMPKLDPLREQIKKLKRDFGIDFFEEMHRAVEFASTLSEMDRLFRHAVLLPEGSKAPDYSITEKDKLHAIETIKQLRDWFEITEKPIPTPKHWGSA